MGLYLGKEKISNVASAITLSADSMATEIQNHIADTDIHITADERTKWNAASENTDNETLFYVNCVISDYDVYDENVSHDKTLEEIKTAYLAGKLCYASVKLSTLNSNNNSKIILPLVEINVYPDQGVNEAIFASSYIQGPDTPNIIDSNYICINSAYAEGILTDGYLPKNNNETLPAVSTAHDGKVLSVVNGAWAAAAMSSGAYVGSYTGTGSYSKTLTFDFKPAIFFIFNSVEGTLMLMGVYGCPGAVAPNSLYAPDVTWTSNSFTLHHSNYIYDFNNGSTTYYYTVIPAMN